MAPAIRAERKFQSVHLKKIIDWRTFGFQWVAGVDEVGRGCIAGPVYSAAVVVRPDFRIRGLTDSKLLTPELRLKFAEQIKEQAVSWFVGVASVEEINTINILRASLLSMRRAVRGLSRQPELVLIDGDMEIGGIWPQMAFVQGDLRCALISAASILAKVARDEYMTELAERVPGYGFEKHKGYGTKAHREALKSLGVTAFHRREFGGVKELIDGP